MSAELGRFFVPPPAGAEGELGFKMAERKLWKWRHKVQLLLLLAEKELTILDSVSVGDIDFIASPCLPEDKDNSNSNNRALGSTIGGLIEGAELEAELEAEAEFEATTTTTRTVSGRYSPQSCRWRSRRTGCWIIFHQTPASGLDRELSGITAVAELDEEEVEAEAEPKAEAEAGGSGNGADQANRPREEFAGFACYYSSTSSSNSTSSRSFCSPCLSLFARIANGASASFFSSSSCKRLQTNKLAREAPFWATARNLIQRKKLNPNRASQAMKLNYHERSTRLCFQRLDSSDHEHCQAADTRNRHRFPAPTRRKWRQKNTYCAPKGAAQFSLTVVGGLQRRSPLDCDTNAIVVVIVVVAAAVVVAYPTAANPRWPQLVSLSNYRPAPSNQRERVESPTRVTPEIGAAASFKRRRSPEGLANGSRRPNTLRRLAADSQVQIHLALCGLWRAQFELNNTVRLRSFEGAIVIEQVRWKLITPVGERRSLLGPAQEREQQLPLLPGQQSVYLTSGAIIWPASSAGKEEEEKERKLDDSTNCDQKRRRRRQQTCRGPPGRVWAPIGFGPASPGRGADEAAYTGRPISLSWESAALEESERPDNEAGRPINQLAASRALIRQLRFQVARKEAPSEVPLDWALANRSSPRESIRPALSQELLDQVNCRICSSDKSARDRLTALERIWASRESGKRKGRGRVKRKRQVNEPDIGGCSLATNLPGKAIIGQNDDQISCHPKAITLIWIDIDNDNDDHEEENEHENENEHELDYNKIRDPFGVCGPDLDCVYDYICIDCNREHVGQGKSGKSHWPPASLATRLAPSRLRLSSDSSKSGSSASSRIGEPARALAGFITRPCWAGNEANLCANVASEGGQSLNNNNVTDAHYAECDHYHRRPLQPAQRQRASQAKQSDRPLLLLLLSQTRSADELTRPADMQKWAPKLITSSRWPASKIHRRAGKALGRAHRAQGASEPSRPRPVLEVGANWRRRKGADKLKVAPKDRLLLLLLLLALLLLPPLLPRSPMEIWLGGHERQRAGCCYAQQVEQRPPQIHLGWPSQSIIDDAAGRLQLERRPLEKELTFVRPPQKSPRPNLGRPTNFSGPNNDDDDDYYGQNNNNNDDNNDKRRIWPPAERPFGSNNNYNNNNNYATLNGELSAKWLNVIRLGGPKEGGGKEREDDREDSYERQARDRAQSGDSNKCKLAQIEKLAARLKARDKSGQIEMASKRDWFLSWPEESGRANSIDYHHDDDYNNNNNKQEKRIHVFPAGKLAAFESERTRDDDNNAPPGQRPVSLPPAAKLQNPAPSRSTLAPVESIIDGQRAVWDQSDDRQRNWAHSGHDRAIQQQQQQQLSLAKVGAQNRKWPQKQRLHSRHLSSRPRRQSSLAEHQHLSLQSQPMKRRTNLVGPQRLAMVNSASEQRLLQPAPASGCPIECVCVWKNGKQFADCSRQQLQTLPKNLDPLLQVLNFSANHLAQLPQAAFKSLNLNNLQRIYLSSCQLKSIHLQAFENLKLVVELDFSWNQLNFVPLPQMRHLTLLRRLVMRGNPLLTLDELTLSGLSPASSANPANSAVLNRSNLDAIWSSFASAKTNQSAHLELAKSLMESYPELVRSFLLENVHLLGNDANRIVVVDNSIIRDAEQTNEFGVLELLQLMAKRSEEEEEAATLEETLGSGAGSGSGSGIGSESETGSIWVSNGSELSHKTNALDLDSVGEQRRQAWKLAHFDHLQELDFGQCKLSYIKWTTFEGLSSLKRLLLDGNQLSQLSGRLVSVLPLNLHQLSLESNPWKCDCRLLALKRWLVFTRTPLNAPVKCASRMQETRSRPERDRRHSSQLEQSFPSGRKWARDYSSKVIAGQRADEPPQMIELSPSRRSASRRARLAGQLLNGIGDDGRAAANTYYLDQLELDEFVCAPQAVLSDASLRKPQSIANNISEQEHSQELRNLTALKWNTLLAYLRPLLIDPSGSEQRNRSGSRPVLGQPRQRSIVMQANEGERVTLTCSMVAYPESSLDIIWLVDYSQQRQPADGVADSQSGADLAVQMARGQNRLPAEERFVVLYDSKLHKLTRGSSETSAATATTARSSPNPLIGGELQESGNSEQLSEISLYGSRILVRESLASYSDSHESLFKESQIIIQSAHQQDSARYKCIGLNKAGNASAEYLLRVSAPSRDSNQQQAGGASRETQTSLASHSTRDQRADGSRQQLLEAASKARALAASQVAQFGQPSAGGQSRGGGLALTNSAPTSSLAAAASPPPTSTTTTLSPSSTWLRSSATFQVTMVIVSVLMAAVILAFLIFCIIIYQIKPNSGGRNSASLAAAAAPAPTTPTNALPMALQFSPERPHLALAHGQAQADPRKNPTNGHLAGSLDTNTLHQLHQMGGPMPLTLVSCDPFTGQASIHLLAGANQSIVSPSPTSSPRLHLGQVNKGANCLPMTMQPNSSQSYSSGSQSSTILTPRSSISFQQTPAPIYGRYNL